MGNKNMQLVLQHCCTTCWKAMLRVLPPMFKPVWQQIRLLQVAWILISDWIKLRGSHAIHGSYVTCSKTSLPWAGKTRNMYRFCRKKKNYSLLSATNLCNLQQADLLQDRFECGWYINTSLFNLFCTNLSKQDAQLFCCPFYHPLL